MFTKVADITVQMPWGPMSARTFGEERFTPVLCVHGRSDNLETFTNLIPLLPHNFFYVCIDLPGHGKSAHADKGYILDLLWYTMCVKRVIDLFKWPKLYYLGHSLGGQIGFFLSALYPDNVLKLIILDSPFYFYILPSNTARALREFVFDALLKFEMRSSLDEAPTYSLSEFVQRMKHVRNTEVTDEQIRAMAERNLTIVGPDRYKYSNDQRTKILGPIHFTLEQLETLAKSIACPILIILGKNSTSTKPTGKFGHSPLSKNINAVFNVIEGDHDVHLARPQQVAHLIVPFLTRETISKL